MFIYPCAMGLLPDICGLRMRLECRERFPRHQLKWKPPVNDPDMHHGTWATYVPWCMSGWLTRIGVENAPGIPGACATRNFTYLSRYPCFIWTNLLFHAPITMVVYRQFKTAQWRILPAYSWLAAVPGVWYHTVIANPFIADGLWPSGYGAWRSSGRWGSSHTVCPGFNTVIQHIKQLAHNWYLAYCQCTGT